MSADLLRRAAIAERDEWSDHLSRSFPKAQAVHFALAAWLDAIAAHWEGVAEQSEAPDDPVDENGWRLEDTLDSHAVTVARQILGEDA